MNKEYVYEDEQETEGLTFKKIGKFFQKSWLRMVIYVIIAALLVTAVAVPVKVYAKSEPIAQTSIEFIYDGIEKGLDPNGAPLNTDNIISPTVLAQAVAEANLQKKIKDISTLRNAMRVEGVLTDEYVSLTEAAANGDKTASDKLRNYNMYSTRFDIIISDPAELGLSDDQAKLLLNKIVACYYKDFQKRYSVTKMFAENSYTLSQNVNMEFTDIYDIYSQSLDSVKSFLQEMSEEGAGFVSTENNTSFTQLLSDLSILRNNYSLFNAYILSNNVWRNKTTARNALLSTQTEIQNRLEALDGENGSIQRLQAQIATINPTTSSTDTSGVHTEKTEYPEIYDTLHRRLAEYTELVEEYTIQLNNIETRLEKLKDESQTDEQTIQNAIANLNALESQTVEFIQKVNATVSDYYDTTFVSSSVSQVQPPVVTRRSMDFNLLVVYAVAVIVALLAAGIVTGVKMAKASSTNKTEQTPDDGKQDKE
ncbi:MAG: YkyA family protein [Clostridiales bacterium]|nr:YkyA family protein [Clostridiales bacterium]